MRPRPPYWAETLVPDRNVFGRTVRRVYNRSGSASVVNKVYMYDLGLTVAAETVANSQGITLPAVSTHNWGGLNSCWMNVIQPLFTGAMTGFARHGVFVVCLEAVADNELMTVLETGECTVDYVSTSVATAFTGTTYTHSASPNTATLTKTGQFASYIFKTGDQVNINSGTNAVTGLHTIVSRTNDDTIVIADAGGTGNETDFSCTLVARLDPFTRLEPVSASGGVAWLLGNSTNKRIALARETVRSLTTSTGSVSVFFSGWGTGLN